MRVYALAKQLGMENRDLIPELKRMGITVASHSSALDDDVVQKVLEKLGPKLKVHGKTAGATAHGRGASPGSPAREPCPRVGRPSSAVQRGRLFDASRVGRGGGRPRTRQGVAAAAGVRAASRLPGTRRGSARTTAGTRSVP